MTSLIDVIFLLLLFFMLTSTFSKFSEVELAAAGASGAAAPDRPPLFLRLGAGSLSLNGREVALDSLTAAFEPEADTGRTVLVSLGPDVSAQRLTDLLVVLRGVPGIAPSILASRS